MEWEKDDVRAAREIVKQNEEKFNRVLQLRKPAWMMKLKPAPMRRSRQASRFTTKFGGSPYLPITEECPVCRTCDNPLSFVFQINLREVGKPIGFYDFLTFYYCWGCSPLRDRERRGFQLCLYQLDKKAPLWLPKNLPKPHYEPELTECLVTWQMAHDYPEWDDVLQAFPEYSELGEEIMDAYLTLYGAKQGSKLGGWPFWARYLEYPVCSCGKRMEFFAQFDSERKAKLMWRDEGLLYLFACPDLCTNDPHSMSIILQSY